MKAHIMKKNISMILCLLLVFFILVGCSSGSDSNSKLTDSQKDAIVSSVPAGNGNLALTADQLAAFDGKKSRPAYIALDGMIYDVSNIKEWKNGSHHGCHAGQDISLAFKSCPHKESILNGVPVVGKLTQ